MNEPPKSSLKGIIGRLKGAFVFRDGNKMRLNLARILPAIGCVAMTFLVFGLGRSVGMRDQESVSEKSAEQSGFAGEVVRLLKKAVGQSTALGSDSSQKSNSGHRRPSSLSRGIGVIAADDLARVQDGVMVHAKLLTAVSNSRVVARIDEPIPLKTGGTHPGKLRIFGTGSIREARLFIDFDRAVDAHGQSFKIQAHAFDPDSKQEGLAGGKIQRWLVRFIGTLGTKVTEAMIEEWSRAQRSNAPKSINDLAEEALRRGGKITAAEEAQSHIGELVEETARIEVAEGTDILIMFEEAR